MYQEARGLRGKGDAPTNLIELKAIKTKQPTSWQAASPPPLHPHPLQLPYLLPKSRKRNWCAHRDNCAAFHSDSAPTWSRWHCAPSDWPNRSACSCRSRSPRDWTGNSMAAMVVHMHNERHELELNLNPLSD